MVAFSRTLLATIYFYVGALHEEKRLATTFGDTYRQYREEVPAFLPRGSGRQRHRAEDD